MTIPKYLLLVMCLFLIPQRLAAQSGGPTPADIRRQVDVVVTVHGVAHYGRLLEWTDSTVQLGCRTRQDRCLEAFRSFLRKDLDALRVRRGTRLGRGLLIGVGIGTAIGAIAGVIHGPEGDLSKGDMAGGVGMVGGIVGGLVGAFVGGRSERWVKIPLP